MIGGTPARMTLNAPKQGIAVLKGDVEEGVEVHKNENGDEAEHEENTEPGPP